MLPCISHKTICKPGHGTLARGQAPARVKAALDHRGRLAAALARRECPALDPDKVAPARREPPARCRGKVEFGRREPPARCQGKVEVGYREHRVLLPRSVRLQVVLEQGWGKAMSC